MSLGIIVAGLKPEDFGSIGECCLDSISREAIDHLTVEHLKALGNKISLLAPESLANINKEMLSPSLERTLPMESIKMLNKTFADVQDKALVSKMTKSVESVSEALTLDENAQTPVGNSTEKPVTIKPNSGLMNVSSNIMIFLLLLSVLCITRTVCAL